MRIKNGDQEKIVRADVFKILGEDIWNYIIPSSKKRITNFDREKIANACIKVNVERFLSKLQVDEPMVYDMVNGFEFEKIVFVYKRSGLIDYRIRFTNNVELRIGRNMINFMPNGLTESKKEL